jgi:hypothetical protein
MYPSDFRAAPRPVRLTLLACLCWQRTAELADGLVDLLIALIHEIDARAEHRVERELLAERHRVRAGGQPLLQGGLGRLGNRGGHEPIIAQPSSLPPAGHRGRRGGGLRWHKAAGAARSRSACGQVSGGRSSG